MILYINACVRKQSRTKKLADKLIRKMDGEVERVDLESVSFPTVDEAFLKKRDRLLASGKYNDPLFDMARQFASADQIVIAAPFWDLSFPAVLKQYFEQINVLGITFMYTPEGVPKGLCRAKKLYYVMTTGGMFVPEEYGFGYVRMLARSFYGIEDVELIKAVGLDIDNADAKAIIRECMDRIGTDHSGR